jgi:NAD(P)-dependent dehydrogenase (short-subunit alcohol dehydrogenase family)
MSAALSERPVQSPAAVFDLTGRTVVVTGASSGLGARFARVLSAAGAQVHAAARRLDRISALAADDERITAVRCDVTDPSDRERLVDSAAARTGRVDVLVNCAAVPGRPDTDSESAADFAAVLETNLVAPYDLCRLIADRVGADSGAAVVNVASILGLVSAAPLAGAGYAASKAGLIGLTRELAGQWGRRGIRVNALAPGWFHTDMNDAVFSDERSAAWVDRNTILRRPGNPAELDGALLFLASAASSYCTGQVLVVDGGWTAR